METEVGLKVAGELKGLAAGSLVMNNLLMHVREQALLSLLVRFPFAIGVDWSFKELHGLSKVTASLGSSNKLIL